ncbi:MAG: thioredoxin family protein [Candidatus Marinarcus sp.]|uniref:thioredoxin family protein n=1 Tax=Candidatus Marinarcus sp. TaxID=3100987 RepID=UPI003B00A568
MQKIFFLLLALYSLLLSENLNQASTYEDAIQQAQAEHKMVLLFLYSNNCPWCKKMKETTLHDAKAIAFINKHYIFLSLNKDTKEYPKAFFPRFIPTTYSINPQTQEEIYALYGYKTSEQLINELSD